MCTPFSSLIFSLLHPHILSSHGHSHFGRTHYPHPPPLPISSPSWPILGYLGSNQVAEAWAVVNQFRAECMCTFHLSPNTAPPNDTRCTSSSVTHECAPMRINDTQQQDHFIPSILLWFHLEGALFKLNLHLFPLSFQVISQRLYSKTSTLTSNIPKPLLHRTSTPCSRSCKVSFNFNFAT
ncbi:hypothetical protein B0H16DRAFT_1580107 [Mycena metata]|uniref:Uncharacterized protein n=1 Tax=Mycena metata TaxID=1033252 RepID=A0AAD7MUV8_9AGAR|nr:hypothetical protein B0H16DRAFT_1580107 [Mycena metata]